MRSSLGLGLALLALGCGPSRVRWEPQPTAPEASSFALVSAGARFHVAPDPRAPAVALAPPGAERAPWLADAFVVVRVLAEEDGWARVETLGAAPEAHCVPEAVPGLRPLRLRLYVESRALAALTVREVTQRFDDGTSIWLARGVPLERLSRDGFHRVRLGALSTVIRLAPSDVGQRYLPSEPRPAAVPAGRLALDALRAGVPILGQTGRVHSAEATEDVPLAAIEPRGSESIVVLAPRCAELSVRVPAHVVGEPPDALAATPEPAAPVAPPWVEAGTEMFWPGGRDAGSVAERLALDRPIEDGSELRCFGRSLHGEDDPGIVLCFRRADVHEPGAAARGLDTPGSKGRRDRSRVK